MRLPPIAPDPISELVVGNSVCLKVIEGKIAQLSEDLSGLHTLAAKVEASVPAIPVPSSYSAAVRASGGVESGSPVSGNSPHSLPISHKVSRLDRAENLMIFGLPEAKSLPDF